MAVRPGPVDDGPQAIVDSHRALFGGFARGTRLADAVLDNRFPAPGVAVVNGRGDTYKGKRPEKLSKIQTCTLVREDDGEWRIAAFQNTGHRPLMEAVSHRLAPGPGPGRTALTPPCPAPAPAVPPRPHGDLACGAQPPGGAWHANGARPDEVSIRRMRRRGGAM
ncbi:SgcJ/EcaC family oxidoreductase [Kitasatospora sp. NPDC048239]|uniref:SgcJ/EcaC family oxidoreductase n=1 Tax=Kitasatospora sp. NPDC048239 TaxID=3364046 RepID=UPI0037225A71